MLQTPVAVRRNRPQEFLGPEFHKLFISLRRPVIYSPSTESMNGRLQR